MIQLEKRSCSLRILAAAAAFGVVLFAVCGCDRTEPAAKAEASVKDVVPAKETAPAGKTALPMLFEYDGSKEPFPIPWLDANGSHNQMPGIRQEPSHIYDFKGLVARCNGFVGNGTDQDGNPVSFGTKTTDFGIMMGEYYTGRTVHKAAFVHL
jgi:hypothetical protein